MRVPVSLYPPHHLLLIFSSSIEPFKIKKQVQIEALSHLPLFVSSELAYGHAPRMQSLNICSMMKGNPFICMLPLVLQSTFTNCEAHDNPLGSTKRRDFLL